MDYNKNISIFPDYFDTTPALSCSIGDFCSNVYHGDYKQEVNAIRREPDKKTRDKIKATLPAVTISGTFSERSKKGLIEYSGFICLDIDAKENPNITDWQSARDNLSHIDNVFFSALSVGGRGVFLVIPIDNPLKHEAHFDALKMVLEKRGYIIDKSCRDVSRLRGISYDDNAKINYKAIPFNKIYSPKKAPIRNYTRQSDDLGLLIDKILQSGLDITNGYENWFEIGRALVNEYGEGGRGIFHNLSRCNNGYKEPEVDKQFNSCLQSPGRATKGTIFHFADIAGIRLK